MAVDGQSEPRFLIFQGTSLWQPTFVFRNFVFFAVTQKRREIGTWSRGKNVGNFVFRRMAPSVMISGDPES